MKGGNKMSIIKIYFINKEIFQITIISRGNNIYILQLHQIKNQILDLLDEKIVKNTTPQNILNSIIFFKNIKISKIEFELSKLISSTDISNIFSISTNKIINI